MRIAADRQLATAEVTAAAVHLARDHPGVTPEARRVNIAEGHKLANAGAITVEVHRALVRRGDIAEDRRLEATAGVIAVRVHRVPVRRVDTAEARRAAGAVAATAVAITVEGPAAARRQAAAIPRQGTGTTKSSPESPQATHTIHHRGRLEIEPPFISFTCG